MTRDGSGEMPFGADPGGRRWGGPYPGRELMRASDADRERVVEVLRDAVVEGRLTDAELRQRLDQTYQAKTYGDLDQVVADLPVTHRPGPGPAASHPSLPSPTGPTARRHPSPVPNAGDQKDLRRLWYAWATAVSVNVAIWAIIVVTSGWVFPWPLWVAGPWGAVLLVATIAKGGRPFR